MVKSLKTKGIIEKIKIQIKKLKVKNSLNSIFPSNRNSIFYVNGPKFILFLVLLVLIGAFSI